jgi:elongation factor 1 alpha-like protein
MGRLLYDLKVVDQRTIDRYKREAEKIGKSSFALAWVLDEGTEEREHGVTIDIAMNKFETEKTSFTILDAPGHKDYVPNMIAGAAQADFAILVLDASTGSFESGLRGQTKEHALLVRSMGVQRLIVAVNKLDSVSWSQARYDEITQQTSAFLNAAGFQPSNVSFVPCSGLKGDNITTPSKDCSWYKGPTLLSLLETSEPTSQNNALSGPLRLPISQVFSSSTQYPLSVAGRITSGSAQVGDQITIIPGGQTGYIKGIAVDDEPSDWAVAGQNTTFHLSSEIDSKLVKGGDMVCPVSAPVPLRSSFTLKVLAFEHLMPMYCSIVVGRLDVAGRISKLLSVLDKATGKPAEGKGKKPRVVKPGEAARLEVVVEADGGVPVEMGARVVLRAEGETVATGIVEHVK